MNEQDLWLALNDLDDTLLLNTPKTALTLTYHRRKLAFVLWVAVLSLTLLGCTYAVLSGADWFKAFFRDKTEHPLTEGQKQYIEEHTEDISQSITCNGYTLTVESALADQYTAYIKLKLTAPPGKILDAESYLSSMPDFDDPAYQKSLTHSDGREIAYTASMGPIEDENPQDGTFSILEVIRLQSHTETTFDVQGTWKLHYEGFDACYDNGESKNIMNGPIDFDIAFTKISNEEVDVVTEPIPYAFKSYRSHDDYLAGNPDITEGFITSLTLRTMSASMTIEGHAEPAGFLKIPIVMKDGSRIYMQPNVFGNGNFTYSLSTPIVMGEVDHILLEDGTKLYLPQK